MARGNSFVVNDSEVAENIEKLFHEYVAIFIQLHYPDGNNAVSDAERRELSLKLKESVNDITLLGLKHRRKKPDAAVEKLHNQQTSGAAASYLPAFN